MSNIANDTLLGIVLIARHGDRLEFFQDPVTYTTSSTSITPLGEQQELALGALVRSLYLNESSPTFIPGFNTTLFDQTQVQVRADAGDEGAVIYDSSIALLQGLFPPTNASRITLANSTVVESPLGGYQYVPVESVELDEDVSLEGFADCNTLDTKTTNFYNSSGFLAVQSEHSAFLNALPPFVDGRPVNLENMWNIFDYMNVQSIHNSTFAQILPPTFLEQARDLANYHEYGVFTDPQFNGIGNIAGRTMIPSILTAIQRISNTSDTLKLHYSAISYKPFLSLFNMTGVVETGELPAAVVNYAAAVILEVRQPSPGSPPVLRFNFKNGTDDDTFSTFNLQFPGWSGTGDVPVSTFVDAFTPAGVYNTTQWCGVCNNSVDRGCAALVGANTASVAITTHHERISPVGAGFLGAGLTAAVFLAAFASLLFFGLLSFGTTKPKAQRGTTGSDRGSENASLQKA